jgi:hypothetical protein
MKNICIAICNMRQWTPWISGIPLSESYTIVLQHQDGPSIYSLFRPYIYPEDGDGSYTPYIALSNFRNYILTQDDGQSLQIRCV